MLYYKRAEGSEDPIVEYKLHEPIVGPKGCKANAASVAVQS